MFRKGAAIWIAAGLVLILGGDSFATEKEMDFRLAREEGYDKEIKEVAIGERDDGGLYPKIVAFEDEVRFYDKESKLIASQPFKRYSDVTLSRKGNYVGILVIERVATKEKLGALSFTVYSDQGKQVSRIEDVKGFDIPAPSFYISSEDGSAIEVYKGLPALAFRNTDGAILKKFRLFDDDRYDITRGALVSRSEDGEFIAVLANEQVPVAAGIRNQRDDNSSRKSSRPIRELERPSGESRRPIRESPRNNSKERQPRSGNPCVILFNEQGTELWRYPLKEYGYGLELSISPKGNVIVASNATFEAGKGFAVFGTYLLTREGSLIGAYDVGTAGGIWEPRIAMSDDEEFVALANFDKIIVIESSSGRMLWERDLDLSFDDRKKEAIVSMDFSSDGSLLVVEKGIRVGDAPCYEPEMLIFDRTGTLLWQKPHPGALFHCRDAKVKLNQEGQEIALVHKDRVSLWTE